MEINFSEEVQAALDSMDEFDCVGYIQNVVKMQLVRDGRIPGIAYVSGGGSAFYPRRSEAGGYGYFGAGGGSPDNIPAAAIGYGSNSGFPLDSATFQILRNLISHTGQTMEEVIDELEARKKSAPDVPYLDVAGEMYGEYLIEKRGGV